MFYRILYRFMNAPLSRLILSDLYIPYTVWNIISIPQYHTTCGQRTFKYRATKIWNTLDEQLKSINPFPTNDVYIRHVGGQ